ncbi:MAG: DUF983 domain-containing protein [Citrobacter freundii]|nr:MAG: DUF983 domain-containing protein [Citrobacter freundii]
MEANKESVPSVLNVLACKCPRCRKGDMFMVKNPYKLKTTMKMHKECPVCKQPFAIEVGFYYGSSYVSYALSIAISVASLIAWWVIVGLSMNDNRFFIWMAFNAVLLVALQPPLMRLARAIWLAFFVRYDRDWKINPPENVERTNSDQENNW